MNITGRAIEKGQVLCGPIVMASENTVDRHFSELRPSEFRDFMQMLTIDNELTEDEVAVLDSLKLEVISDHPKGQYRIVLSDWGEDGVIGSVSIDYFPSNKKFCIYPYLERKYFLNPDGRHFVENEVAAEVSFRGIMGKDKVSIRKDEQRLMYESVLRCIYVSYLENKKQSHVNELVEPHVRRLVDDLCRGFAYTRWHR